MVWGRGGKPASRRRCREPRACGLLLVLCLVLILKSFPPSTLCSQEEVSRGDDRPCVPAVLSEKRTDASNAGNHNKVKVMATQLLAKFEENAPAPQTGLKRQVRMSSASSGSGAHCSHMMEGWGGVPGRAPCCSSAWAASRGCLGWQAEALVCL